MIVCIYCMAQAVKLSALYVIVRRMGRELSGGMW